MIQNEKVESAEQGSAAKAKTTVRKFNNHRVTRPTGDTTNNASGAVTEKTKYNDQANSPRTFQSVKESIEKKIDIFFEANKDSGLRKLVSASKLMEAGAHVGMQVKFWNPKMKPYTYHKKGNKTQVIDILKTMVFLDRAFNFLKEISKDGGRILIVGTKGDIIKEHVKNEAKRVKALYVNQRWLGGTLTNFKTIFKSIEKLNNLISLQLSDEIKKYSKKEQVMMSKEVERMGKFLGGIRVMRSLPQVIIVTDPIVEHNAVAEARQLGIPVIAFANTNANPELVDFLIPANTNSIRTVYLLISILCDAIAEAAGEPTLVIGKKDEEIILPEIAKKEPNRSFIQHKRFTRGGYSGGGYNKPYNSAPKTTEK